MKFQSAAVKAIFDSYPTEIHEKIFLVRQLIFDVASASSEIGQIEETLKWGEPSYLTKNPRSGSTIRLHWKASMNDRYTIYFNCRTNLVDIFCAQYPDIFTYDGNRALLLGIHEKLPQEPLKHCLALALTYYNRKHKQDQTAEQSLIKQLCIDSRATLKNSQR